MFPFLEVGSAVRPSSHTTVAKYLRTMQYSSFLPIVLHSISPRIKHTLFQQNLFHPITRMQFIRILAALLAFGQSQPSQPPPYHLLILLFFQLPPLPWQAPSPLIPSRRRNWSTPTSSLANLKPRIPNLISWLVSPSATDACAPERIA